MASLQGFQALKIEKNRMWGQSSAILSFVILGHRRRDLLARAISSVERACGNGNWEMVLVTNGASPSVEDYAAELLQRNAFPLAVVPIDECRPGAARNYGVRQARAPLLFFLDDDIECYQDIATAAVDLFRDPALQAAGGANLTPPNSTALARATGGMMASRFGAASMSQRYRLLAEGGPASEHGLILCNLAVRRAVFESERGFATHMISNEENVLLQRLEGRGSRLWSSPRLAVYHCRRDTWKGLCSQAAKYGSGRAQNLILLPESMSALYFLPLAFLFYLLSLPLLFLAAGSSAILPLVVYVLLSLSHSFSQALLRRDWAHLLAIQVFPLVHLSYGIGFLRALLVWSLRRKELREHTA